MGVPWWQIFLYACGLALLPGTLAILWREWRTRWERTTGTILGIHVAEPGSFHKRYFTPLVEFRYTVKGETITSMTFWDRQPICETMELAVKEIERYSVGAIVTVKFRPDLPARAFVTGESRWATGLLNVLGVLVPFLVATLYSELGKYFPVVLVYTAAVLSSQAGWLSGAPRTVRESGY